MDYNWGTVTIDQDRMAASITLKCPKEGESFDLSSVLLKEALKQEGISAKADETAIQRLLHNTIYNKPMVVVRGKQPQRGKDGFFTFNLPTEDMRIKPVINPDGSADFEKSMRLAMISENDIFAHYTPATRGEYGYDIFSKMITPASGKELPPLHGHGVLSNDEKTEYRAEYSGHMTRQSNTVNIHHLLRVGGNMDMNMEDIAFEGDVEVLGDVLAGSRIEAGGNIFVHGHVGACELRAGKSIIIQKGIQGQDNCLIVAGGNVACKFVERAEIISSGSLYTNSILNATVIAREQIIVSGTVLSSKVRGMLGVTVREAGNKNEIPTILQSGVPQEEIDRAAALAEQLREVDDQLKSFENHQRIYDAAKNMTPEIRELRLQLLRAKIVVSAQQKKIQDELNPLLELIEVAHKISQVRILGIAHAGIQVNIFGENYSVEDPVMDIKYSLSGHRIIVESGSKSYISRPQLSRPTEQEIIEAS